MDSYQDARSAIGAALDNARELLTAARALLDAGQPARLAYHFAALALEEVGKASILGMRVVRAARDRDLPTLLSDEALQDHVRKLFWAIWGPTIGRDVNSRFARRNHANGPITEPLPDSIIGDTRLALVAPRAGVRVICRPTNCPRP